MVTRQAETSAPGPVSAVAAWKAKQNLAGNTTITRNSQNTLLSKQDTENHDEPPPAKKQKIEPETLPSEQQPPKNKNKSKVPLPPLPIPQLSQCSVQPTGTRDSPIDVDSEEARSNNETYRMNKHIRAPLDKNLLEDESASDGEEGETLDSDSGSEIILQTEAPKKQLSSFIPTKDNVVGETIDEWTVLLSPGDSITLLGQYDVWVRKGAISIAGAVLHASSRLHRVYAPSTQSLPSIHPIPNPYGPQNIPAEITIHSCTSRLRLLKNLSPKLGHIWNHKTQLLRPGPRKLGLSQRSFVLLNSSTDDPYKRPLHIIEPPLDWGVMIARLLSADNQAPISVMLCGPKGSGKSTFCRILANSLLTRTHARSQPNNSVRGNGHVAFLDLDPGQPEFSPPGEISLIQLRSCNFGPPFTHPTPFYLKGDQSIRAHHIGAVTPKDDPEHYLMCALDLWNHYRRILRLYPLCPLIINCSGWVLGSGLEILQELISCMKLTHIVYMSTVGLDEVVGSLVEAAGRAKTPIHTLTSQPSEFAMRTAADLRMMQTLSYFHLDESEDGDLRWNPSPLSEMPPLIVHYAGPKQAIFGIMVLGEEQDPENLMDILVGCVVGLVAIEDDSAIPVENNEDQDLDIRDLHGFSEREEQAAENIQDTEDFRILQARTDFDSRIDSSSDLDSDKGSASSFRDSFRPSPKSQAHVHVQPTKKPKLSASHLNHPVISRTPSVLPYFPPRSPLNPQKSHSLGQALIRGIDTVSKTLHLITPVPPATLQSLHAKGTKIVLVRGKLDTPVWAYKEELVAAAARRRRRKGDGGMTGYEVREWARGVPWAKVAEPGNDKGKGAKVWRVRRHLRPKVREGSV